MTEPAVDSRTDRPPTRPRPRAGRSWLALAAGVVLLALSMILAAGFGSTHLSAHQVFLAVLHGPPGDSDTSQVDNIVWGLRLPRILLAALVGPWGWALTVVSAASRAFTQTTG